MLVALSAPSGAGKTTIARALLEAMPGARFSISATTRARRQNETHGVDYYFFTREEFEARIAAGGMVEYEEIFGNYYGTLRSETERALHGSELLIFDIDVKGALSLKRLFPDEAVLIFIQPPSLEELRSRIEKRGANSPEDMENRLARAAWEMKQAANFDYTVVNDDLDRAIEDVISIVQSRLIPEMNTKRH